MLLSGLILGCFLQLTAAQQRKFSVHSDPHRPQLGQDVTLSLQNGPSEILSCQWIQEGRTGRKNVFSFNPSPTESEVSRRRQTLRPDCSLRITNLEASDEGNYSVTINTNLSQKRDDTQTQGELYQASFYLQVSNKVSVQNIIKVDPRPRYPSSGQNVTLLPEGIPRRIHFCKWSRENRFGLNESLGTHVPGQQHQTQQKEGLTVRSDCSLFIWQIKKSDAGQYNIQVEAPVQHQHQPGSGTEQQDVEGPFQIYWGQVSLEVNDQSKTDPRIDSACGPLSLSFGAWIMAAAFIGSVAW